MKLQELAGELRTQLLEFFQTVRITAIQNADQFLAELAAINPDKLHRNTDAVLNSPFHA